MRKKLLSLLFVTLLVMPLWAADEITPDEIIVYKETPQRELSLHVFYPNDQKKGKNRPAIISFFGGGWAAGSPSQFYAQSEYFASLGMVAISVDYRVMKQDKTTPFEAVMDAKSAVRWVRQNSKLLGIDPDKIVASGGSAGGHLAACTAIIEGCEDDKKLKVSSVPNALILFNPVVKTTKDGYGANSLVGRETEISPTHHIRPNLPPTLIMHGTQDTTVPFKNAVEFDQKMRECGNDCRLITAFGENHGFFNGKFRASFGLRNFDRCMYASTKFLIDLGILANNTEITKPEPVRVACLGNSITFGARVEDREKNSYPAQLQNMLGEDYDVKNFGKSGANVLNEGNLPYIKNNEYKQLVEYAPDVIIIKLGTNDSKAKNWQYKDKFEEDFTSLIKSLRKNSHRSPQIYICSPVPAFTDKDSEFINAAIIQDEIYPAVKQIAKKNKLFFIDAFQPFEDRPDLFPDQIHPGAEGAKLLAEVIYNAISAKK